MIIDWFHPPAQMEAAPEKAVMGGVIYETLLFTKNMQLSTDTSHYSQASHNNLYQISRGVRNPWPSIWWWLTICDRSADYQCS